MTYGRKTAPASQAQSGPSQPAASGKPQVRREDEDDDEFGDAAVGRSAELSGSLKKTVTEATLGK